MWSVLYTCSEIKKIEIKFYKKSSSETKSEIFWGKKFKKIYHVDAGFVSFSYSKFTVDPESLQLGGGAV